MSAKSTLNEAKAEVQEKAQPTKFSVEKLGANCKQLFGVSSCTYAGATNGMTGEYTVEEMKAHIEKWCGTPLETKKDKEAKK